MALNVYKLQDGSSIRQEVFVGAESDVIAVTITSDNPVDVNLSMDGTVPQGEDLVKVASADGQSATEFVCRIRACPADKVNVSENSLQINGAENISVYVSVATDFNRKGSRSKLAAGSAASMAGRLCTRSARKGRYNRGDQLGKGTTFTCNPDGRG